MPKINNNDFVEKFIDSPVSEDIASNGGICQNCFIKFNEYDEHISKAEAIQMDLTQLLLDVRDVDDEDKFIEFKSEPGEEVVYTEYDENMVEVLPEQYIDSYLPSEINSPVEIKQTPIKQNAVVKSPAKTKRPPAVVKAVEKPRVYSNKNDKDNGFIITIIDGAKRYTCEMCLKHFVNRSRLRSHRLTHSKVRAFRCDQCGANFKTSNCLKNHIRGHLNIHYFCDLCENKSFRGRHELRCHMDAIHLGKKDHIW